ncbi:MAG: redoxin domain-containing protein [Myxococcota bacterium]
MKRALIAMIWWVSACARVPLHSPRALELELAGSDGRRHDVAAELRATELTVFIFVSRSCGILPLHEPRLAELHARYAGRNVAFRLVDSEVGVNAAVDADFARQRGYHFPLLSDPGAHLAAALNAEFATHTVIVDRHAVVRYAGGIDSDRNRLHADARLYLRDALDDLLAGREPRVARGEALGCALRLD